MFRKIDDMKNQQNRLLCCFYFLFITIPQLYAQVKNCAVNAGVASSVCPGESIKLKGNLAGEITIGTAQWTQVSGPKVIINQPTQINTSVSNAPPGTYVFKLSAQCTQGMAEQTVTHTVYPDVKAYAGKDTIIYCYNFDPIVMHGYAKPPAGYFHKWSILSSAGYFDGDILNINIPFFDLMCKNGISDTTLNIFIQYYNPVTGCSFTDSKKIQFKDFLMPLAILKSLSAGASCPDKLEEYAAAVSCTSGTLNGQWSFVSPPNGGGASFLTPNSVNTGFSNLTPGTKYTIQWTEQTKCGTTRVATTSFVAVLAKKVAPLPDVDDRVFCDPPDSIILTAPRPPDKSKNENANWTFLDIDNITSLPDSVAEAYRNIRILGNYTYDSLSLPITGFRSGYLYRFQYTITNGVCQTETIYKILVLGNHASKTYSLANECGLPFDNACVKDKKLCFKKPSIKYFGYLSEQDLFFKPLPVLVSAPPGVSSNSLHLDGTESSFWIDSEIPNGTYIFRFNPDENEAGSACIQSQYYHIYRSGPPIKSNAGTDIYVCTDKAQLPGNAVLNPNWYLLDKLPSNIPNPIMKGDSTTILSLEGLSSNSQYRFVYRSWGGIKCESAFDTVSVFTANMPPPAPNAGADITVCGGSNISLSGSIPPNAGIVPQWSLIAQNPSGKTPTIINPNNPNTQVTNVVPNTIYTFRYTYSNGCGVEYDDIVITTDANPGPNPPDLGKDQCLRSGSTVAVLIATAPSPNGAIGIWSADTNNPNPTIFSSPNKNATNVSGLKDGNSYRFIYTVSFGVCGKRSDTTIITINSNKNGQIIDSSLVFCNVKIPTSYTLKATDSKGIWSQIDGVPGVIFSSITDSITTVSNLQEGSYKFRWQVQNGVCKGNYDDIYLHIGGATPIVRLDNDTTLCASTNGIYKLKAPNPNGLVGYWTFEQVSSNVSSAGGTFVQNTTPSDPNATVQLNPGKSRLRWSLIPNPPCNTQPSYDDIIIEYVPKGSIFLDTISFCDGKLISLKADNIGNTTGTWSQIAGNTVSALPKNQVGDNPIFVNLPAVGTYRFAFKAQSTALCPSSQDEVTVINYALPPYPDIGLEDTMCVRNGILLNANVLPKGYIATWTVLEKPLNATSPFFSPNANAQNVRVSNLKKGKYVFQYTITNGVCTLSDVREDSIRLNTIDAGLDIEICKDTFYQLKTPTNNLFWTVFPKNQYPSTVNKATGRVSGLLQPGEYYYYLNDNQGCYDDIKITKRVANRITATPADVTVCVGGNTTFSVAIDSVRKPLVVQWQLTADNGKTWSNIVVTNNTSYTTPPLTQNNTSQRYRVIVSDALCGNDTSATFGITANAAFELLAKAEVCNLNDGNDNNYLDFSTLIIKGSKNVQWQSLDAAEPTGTWNKKDFTGWEANKTFRFVATTLDATAPCINVSDTIAISIKPCCPILCVTKDTIELCNGVDSMLNINRLLCPKTAAGSWFVTQSPQQPNPDVSNNTFNPLGRTAGIYQLEYTLSGNVNANCKTTINQYIDVKSSPNVGKYRDTLKVCFGIDTLLDFQKVLIGADADGIWKATNAPINSKGQMTIQKLAAGNYFVTYTIKGKAGCSDVTLKIPYSIIGLPPIEAGNGYAITCKKPIVELNATVPPNIQYVWLNPNGSGVNPTNGQYLVTGIGNYTLVAKSTLTGCISKDSTTIVANEPFIKDINTVVKNPPCEGAEVGGLRVVSIEGGSSPFEYYLNGNLINANDLSKNQVPGDYTLLVRDRNGCEITRQFSIKPRVDWEAYLKRDTTIDWGQSAYLEGGFNTALSDVKYIKWLKQGFVFDTTFVLNQLVNPTRTTTYEIVGIDANGCQHSAKVIVSVIFDPKVYVPNIFSPNGDGKNDLFQLYANRFVKTIHRFDIYDRWGEWVYSQGKIDAQAAEFGWDGTFRGQPMNNAIFVWVAEVEYINGERVFLKGDITLIRD